MLRTVVGCCVVVMMGLGLAPVSAAERVGPPTAKGAASIPLPPRIVSACARATHEMRYVCDEYATVYRQNETMRREAEAARIAAERRLKEMTRGGVVETLQ